MAGSKSGEVVGAVVGAVVSAGVAALLAWLTPLGPWAWRGVVAVWDHFGSRSMWPNWSLYLLVLLALHSIASVLIRFRPIKEASWKRFDKLSFLNVTWRWVYISNNPTQPTGFCPSCDTQLVYFHSGGGFTSERLVTKLICERCDRICHEGSGDLTQVVGRAEREIDRLLRNGEWRRHVPQEVASK